MNTFTTLIISVVKKRLEKLRDYKKKDTFAFIKRSFYKQRTLLHITPNVKQVGQ